MRNLHLALFVWCLLVVLPGYAVAEGVFGNVVFIWRGARLDNAGIPAGATAAWIVGYMAQLLLFIWATRASALTQKIVGIFAASALPWGVNWTLPVASWAVLPWLLVTVGVAVWVARAAGRAAALVRDGLPARGVVLEVEKPRMNVVVNNVYIKRNVRLRIEREDGAEPYEGVLNGLFMIGQIPEVGATLRLRVDPNDPQHFEAVEAAATHAAPKPRSAGVAEELERLARLRDRGAMTDAEFTAAKRKVLGD